jgi:hypothetical protein
VKRDFPIPDEIDERLWAWARYFRDRHTLGKCGSAEGNYRPHGEDFEVEGWDKPAPPQIAPARPGAVLEAMQTNDEIMKLSRVQKWSLTYHYCYPSLPRFVILKCMRKFAGKRLTWIQFQEQVDLARIRLSAVLCHYI